MAVTQVKLDVDVQCDGCQEETHLFDFLEDDVNAMADVGFLLSYEGWKVIEGSLFCPDCVMEREEVDEKIKESK